MPNERHTALKLLRRVSYAPQQWLQDRCGGMLLASVDMQPTMYGISYQGGKD